MIVSPPRTKIERTIYKDRSKEIIGQPTDASDLVFIFGQGNISQFKRSFIKRVIFDFGKEIHEGEIIATIKYVVAEVRKINKEKVPVYLIVGKSGNQYGCTSITNLSQARFFAPAAVPCHIMEKASAM